MRRAVLVIGATVVGLVGVLSFHTSPAKLSLGALAAGTPTRSTATTTPAGASPPTTGPPPPAPTTTTPPTGSTPATTPATTSPPTTAAPTTTTAPAATRSATGPSVDYNFGQLSVAVTATGSKITNVTIASLNDGGNPRSQSIDQQSIPMLEQQALQAQSANIQGVSGASYTSSGFQQSLQGVLSQLGFK
jgi:uncharacterized protein with FMN-binding domain